MPTMIFLIGRKAATNGNVMITDGTRKARSALRQLAATTTATAIIKNPARIQAKALSQPAVSAAEAARSQLSQIPHSPDAIARREPL